MTIAFLDHHLDNWHAKVFLGMLRDRGHDVVAYETNPLAGDWCAANHVRRAQSVDEALAASDAVMVLAPDDIEAHLELCLAAVPSGKAMWVDKLLAANVDHSLRILRAAQYHSTPVTAGSSLRHAAELEDVLGEPVDEAFFSGYGAWDRYGVHTVAMALRVFGGGVRRFSKGGTPKMPTVTLEWSDGRRCVVVVAESKTGGQAFPWHFALRRGDEYVTGTVTQFEEFYRRQLEAILSDFESGATMEWDEMLDTVKILERVPEAKEGTWTEL